MKKIFIVMLLLVVALSCFSEPLNFAGFRWYQLMGTSFYTTCITLDELKELGKLFEFDIEKPSDIIRNLKGDAIKVEWDDYYENFYSDQVKDGDLNQGRYLVDIDCDPEMQFFKLNSMTTVIKIIKVRDNSFARAYKSQKIVELTLNVY